MGHSIQSLRGVVRSWLVYYGRPWQSWKMRRFYRQFLGPQTLGFDIGSHLGNRVRPWAQLGAKVVALEPQGHFYRFLDRKFRSHDGIQVLRKAVGAREEVLPMFVSDLTPTVSSLSTRWQSKVQVDRRFHDVEWNRTEEVSVVTLDKLIEEYGLPDFCKIDVEGFELEVLKGLSKPIPAVSFEYLPADKERAAVCVEELSRLGDYEFNVSLKERMRFSLPDWQSADEILKYLDARQIQECSGDIYARLCKVAVAHDD